MDFKITKGIVPHAKRVVLYGVEGIGKSTFASRFPEPLFIDTEGSTKSLDVSRLPDPESWTDLCLEIGHVARTPGLCKTLVIDTADWAEQLAIDFVCTQSGKDSIEGFGFGKGYTLLANEMKRMLNALDEVIDAGINVVITAHSAMRKFEQPDEMGSYDRWELKLTKKAAPLLKEWADLLLFVNYEQFTVKDDNGKTKVKGGKRVMYASHNPCWDAKNRYGLPDKMDFDYGLIANLFADVAPDERKDKDPLKKIIEDDDPNEIPEREEAEKPKPKPKRKAPAKKAPPKEAPPQLDKNLTELEQMMQDAGISEDEMRQCAKDKGWVANTDVAVSEYETAVPGITIYLKSVWNEVVEYIRSNDGLPF